VITHRIVVVEPAELKGRELWSDVREVLGLVGGNIELDNKVRGHKVKDIHKQSNASI
jgi:hypothetical protein